jgi:hypothetical protein
MDAEKTGRSPAALELYDQVLMDQKLRMLRQQFSETTSQALSGTASWLGIDSLLGGGDWREDNKGATPDPDRHMAFRASAVVIEMASDLVLAALSQLRERRLFAAAALIRQVLETEYLIAAFDSDFSHAVRWTNSSPAEIRKFFSPRSMREIGGFSNSEYWNHCDMGGHPAPKGRLLLRFASGQSESEQSRIEASLWADFAQHLRRLWMAVDRLLLREHARYKNVRRSQRETVLKLMSEWEGLDPFHTTVDFGLLDDLITTEQMPHDE